MNFMNILKGVLGDRAFYHKEPSIIKVSVKPFKENDRKDVFLRAIDALTN
jgi:hypothetical protein